MKIMFISRGRGRGHASPDIEIVRELKSLMPEVQVTFVSYSTGAQTLRDAGFEPIDLKLPENNPFFDTLIRITDVAKQLEPAAIVAHEEFSAPISAAILQLPCLFITDWLPSAESFLLDAVSKAHKILYMDEPGIAEEPVALKDRIEYLCPLIGQLKHSITDRPQVRRELGLPLDMPVILVAPGGSSSSKEEQSPIFQLVMSAVNLLPNKCTVLWILSKEEQTKLSHLHEVPDHVVFLEPHRDFDRTMVAADIAITKGTRKTNFELNALGIPSITLTFGFNPIDDWRVPQISTNTTLHARSITSAQLSQQINKVLQFSNRCDAPRHGSVQNGCLEAAVAISRWLPA